MGERIIIGIVLVTLILTIGAVLRGLAESLRRSRSERAQAELIGRMIDKFGTAPEMVAFLQGEGGRTFLRSPTIDRPGTPYARIMNSVQAGCVLTVFGFGLQILNSKITVEHQEDWLILGGVVLALGAALLVSGGVSFALSKSLGLLRSPMPDLKAEE